MRILGVSKLWLKLRLSSFTTFRFPRRDNDWQLGEFVQVVYKPRSKNRIVLGTAQIINTEQRRMAIADWTGPNTPLITNREAITDCFDSYQDMWTYLTSIYPLSRLTSHPMNKLTLVWVNRYHRF